MQIVNSLKLLNVRVSKPVFEFIKANAAFTEDKIPFEHGVDNSLLKDMVVISYDFHIEKLTRIASKNSFAPGWASQEGVKNAEKQWIPIEKELNKLYVAMQNEKAKFAYIMVDVMARG